MSIQQRCRFRGQDPPPVGNAMSGFARRGHGPRDRPLVELIRSVSADRQAHFKDILAVGIALSAAIRATTASLWRAEHHGPSVGQGRDFLKATTGAEPCYPPARLILRARHAAAEFIAGWRCGCVAARGRRRSSPNGCDALACSRAMLRTTLSTGPASRSLFRHSPRGDGPRDAISKSNIATPPAIPSACTPSRKSS